MRTPLAIAAALGFAVTAAWVARWSISRAAEPLGSRRLAAPVGAAHGHARLAVAARIRTSIASPRSGRLSPAALADRIIAACDRRWQARRRELQAEYMRGRIDSDGLAAASLEHDAELDRELQAALGPDSYRAWDMNRILQGLNITRVSLSGSERNAVYALERYLRDNLRQAELGKLQGEIAPETFTETQRTLQQDAASRLRALLGAGRASLLVSPDDTRGTLERALEGAPMTPEQLDELAVAKRDWDRARSDLVTKEVNTGDPSLDNQILSNDATWRAAFEQIAGPAAYEQYEKSQDSRYEVLQRNAERWGVPSADVDRVFAAIKNFEESVHEYSLDADRRGVDPATSEAAIQALARRSEQALDAEIGGQAFENLQRHGIGMTSVPSRSSTAMHGAGGTDDAGE